MKKLIVALSISFLFITSSMGASQYDGIWVIKDLHVTQLVNHTAVKLSGKEFTKGPTERFILIAKYGDVGIISIVEDGGYVFSNPFSIIKGNLYAPQDFSTFMPGEIIVNFKKEIPTEKRDQSPIAGGPTPSDLGQSGFHR